MVLCFNRQKYYAVKKYVNLSEKCLKSKKRGIKIKIGNSIDFSKMDKNRENNNFGQPTFSKINKLISLKMENKIQRELI